MPKQPTPQGIEAAGFTVDEGKSTFRDILIVRAPEED